MPPYAAHASTLGLTHRQYPFGGQKLLPHILRPNVVLFEAHTQPTKPTDERKSLTAGSNQPQPTNSAKNPTSMMPANAIDRAHHRSSVRKRFMSVDLYAVALRKGADGVPAEVVTGLCDECPDRDGVRGLVAV